MPEIEPKVILLSHTENPENTVAMAAKLCYSKSNLTDLQEKIEKKDQATFIKHLAEVGHESPLEHACFTFGIEGISRAASHQLVRHRLCSFSQQSQRYCDFQDEELDFIVPPAMKAVNEEHGMDVAGLQSFMDEVKQWYKAMRSWGLSPEDARFVLPNAAATRIIMTANARELRHIFNVRLCSLSQWEIRAIVKEMWLLVTAIAPNIFAGSGPNCVSTGHCSEGSRSCGKMKEMVEIFSLSKERKME